MAVAEAEKTEIDFPEWTEYRKKNGLDSLGMRNSSISLCQTFLPGIRNVTLRMRYNGFHAWLCRTYAKRIGSINPEDWKRFIRRAEAPYSLIACKRGGESCVAGIEWAQKALDSNGTGSIDFATAADPETKPTTSSRHGAYTGWPIAASSSKSEFLPSRRSTRCRHAGARDAVTPEHEMPLPGAEIGEPLAEAFASAIGDLADLVLDVLQDGHVTRENLDRLALLAPSEIGSESDERRPCQNVLLTPAGANDEAGRRAAGPFF